MSKPSITSRSHHTRETAKAVSDLANDVLSDGSKVKGTTLRAFADRTLTRARQFLWGAVDYSTIMQSQKPKIPADTLTLQQIRALVPSVHGAQNLLREIILSQDFEKRAAPSDTDNWRERRRLYCDTAANQTGVNLGDLAKRLDRLVRSNNSQDQCLSQELLSWNFLAAYRLAVNNAAHKSLVFDVAAIFALGNAQRAVQYVSDWNWTTRNTVIGGSLSFVFPIAEGKGDLGHLTIYHLTKFLGDSAKRCFLYLQRTYREQQAGLGDNGKWPGAVVDLHNASNGDLTATPSSADPNVTERTQGPGVGVLVRCSELAIMQIDRWQARFGKVLSLREQCIADLAISHQIPIGSSVGTTHFRNYAAGLSQPALLLAIVVDALRIARLFQSQALWNESAMALVDPNIVPHSASDDGDSINALFGLLGEKPAADWCVGKSLLGELGYLAGLAKQKYVPDHKVKDEQIATIFLDYVDSVDNWHAVINPQKDWQSYRDYHWQGLYFKLGII